MQGMEKTQPRTSLMIDVPTYQRLAEVARQNERSASAEARLAIRRHLDVAATKPPGSRSEHA
jgi:hypothetical protein